MPALQGGRPVTDPWFDAPTEFLTVDEEARRRGTLGVAMGE